MNKVVVVMDEPRSCGNCPLAKSRKHIISKEEIWYCNTPHYDDCGCFFMPIDIEAETRPDWCPIKLVPKRLTGDNSIKYQLSDYEDGWNHCLDMLLD